MFGWRTKQEAPAKRDAVKRLRRGTTTEAVLPLTLPRSNEAWLPAQLQPVHRRGTEPGPCGEPSTSGRELELRWPLRLGFSAVAGGRPDLQLRVLEFSYGAGDLRPAPFIQHAGPQGLAESAAAMLFLRLMFPDQCPALQKALACAGAAAAARPGLAAAERRLRLGQRLPQLQLRGRMCPGIPAAVAQRWQARAQAARRRAAGLAQAAALLAAAAALWRAAHPGSFQLAQAVAVAFQLSCGYASTGRQAARGRIPPGPRLEAAWRARHKWAARKAAPVLGEACEAPPLRPLLSAAQRLSLHLALLTAELPASVPSAGPSPACGGGAAAAAWSLAASYPAGRRLQEAQPREPAAAATGGQLSTSAMPAVESGRAPPAAAAPAAARPRQGGPGQAAPAPAAALPPHFVPSEAEAMFPTSRLPTIASFQELAAHQAAAPRVAVTADASQAAQQQAAPPSQQQQPEQAEQAAQALVPFTAEELLQLDPGMGACRAWGPADEGGAYAGLPLFGRADHAPPPRLGLLELQQMALRAFYLQLLFLPFALLAPLLLLLARLSPQPSAAAAAPAEAHWARAAAWRLLLFCVRRSGPAAIKWAQWSSSREDMFPRDLCAALGQLTDAAPTHAWRDSRRQIRAAFGRPPEELFESIEPRPLASGSIAQVHRAVMLVGGKRRDVAVKVRHPGVDARIRQDFRLLQPLAAAASKVPALRGLSLKESLAQFSSTMTAQTDLRVEAAHLTRFCRNFAGMRGAVTPPFPLPGLVSEAVLVETFEPGQSVARFIRQPAPFNTEIVALGVDTYLKMLLTDNFVHTDLHPGNILVRRRDGGPLRPGAAADAAAGGLQLVLLDFGLAEELTPAVRRHFLSFLHMIARGDGLRAAHHILCWSRAQRCPNPAAFSLALQRLFAERCDILAPGGIELDAVMKAVLREARRFEVSIDSGYAALVVGVAIIVGFATSLDPRVNLMDAAAPAFLQNALLGRVTGRLYS